ncbi:MAG: YheV family putative metal-binding protein [Cellvibrionaceae bacterium]|nr:YheV family putative metal-binding protein [Cellvibrionaceae bacterium]MCV6624486.1 YheV family putative metal-binding protein [Cellvibrionaceae bacterium]
MAFTKKRRFIAGAVCPKCSAMDKIVVYSEQDQDWRECVACGYQEKMHFKPKPKELETRVNTPDEVKKEQLQVLQFPPK